MLDSIRRGFIIKGSCLWRLLLIIPLSHQGRINILYLWTSLGNDQTPKIGNFVWSFYNEENLSFFNEQKLIVKNLRWYSNWDLFLIWGQNIKNIDYLDIFANDCGWKGFTGVLMTV